MARTLNVGMIGYKFMGRAHSNAWLKADKFFKLKARPFMKVICGRDKAGVSEMAYRFGWDKFVTDWREVVNDPTIDIVDINTPNDTDGSFRSRKMPVDHLEVLGLYSVMVIFQSGYVQRDAWWMAQ